MLQNIQYIKYNSHDYLTFLESNIDDIIIKEILEDFKFLFSMSNLKKEDFFWPLVTKTFLLDIQDALSFSADGKLIGFTNIFDKECKVLGIIENTVELYGMDLQENKNNIYKIMYISSYYICGFIKKDIKIDKPLLAIAFNNMLYCSIVGDDHIKSRILGFFLGLANGEFSMCSKLTLYSAIISMLLLMQSSFKLKSLVYKKPSLDICGHRAADDGVCINNCTAIINATYDTIQRST